MRRFTWFLSTLLLLGCATAKTEVTVYVEKDFYESHARDQQPDGRVRVEYRMSQLPSLGRR